MLVVDRASGAWEDRSFRDLPQYLRPGDCLVLNNSRVFPARLFARRRGLGGEIEVFLLRPLSSDCTTWHALVRPGRKVPAGEKLEFGGGLAAEVVARGEHGERTVRLICEGNAMEKIQAIGHVPLPPYIRRPDRASDRDRYQTVYASQTGSVAAPTAGLHFTEELLARCRDAGVGIAEVTLHVGWGTFQPLRSGLVEQNRLHAEMFEVPGAARERIGRARRIVAVGTTSVRAIESDARGRGGETDLFIYPGFEFRRTGALVTNFHLPRSSLLLLVCAFGGKELILGAYRHAVAEKYRFFSYGDCMLIL